MLPIRSNALGLVMFVMGGVIAALGLFVFKLGDAVIMLAIGTAVIAADLIIRWQFRTATGWLTNREFGGYFFFAPMWVIGIVAIVGGVANAVSP